MTGRAGRGCHPNKSSQNVSADATDKRNIERIGQPVLRIAVENHKAPELPPASPRTGRAERGSVASAPGRGQLAGLAESNREQRTFGSGAAPAFVLGAVNDRLEPYAAPHEQLTDALGA